MKNSENKDFNEGYATGRAYYTNDIQKEIFQVKQAIKAIETYCQESTGNTLQELRETVRILEIVLEKSKDPKFL